MVKGHDLDETVTRLIQGNEPNWKPDQRICIDCAAKYVEARNKLEQYHPKFLSEGMSILPTPLRVGAVSDLTGRGITMAFLDSGFYAHPDLVEPISRIKKYVNILNPQARIKELKTPGVSSWHGMMTSVVAAGNGHLSEGIYKGIASDAELILIKIGEASRIKHEDIERGLRWVLKNKDKFNIRIVNISAGGDREVSYLTDALSQAAEELVRAGVVVVAASGNSGDQPNHPVLPPASSPSVIAVGGLDDKNRLDRRFYSLYRSSYGPTIDGLQKPEILAPSIWLAAPILPGTPTQEEAELLDELRNAEENQVKIILKEHPGIDAELDSMIDQPAYLIRQMVDVKLRNNNVISGNYKHVDGTSFAAPIVSSVIAQMLEANPNLTPQRIKRILIDTAKRLPGVEVDRQGWGIVNPAAAVKLAYAFRND
ncbi:MAG TPA: S8 family serine peptidase [Blastocatellia bacterium]|nr:S8 family serine peptidase [Blastocatellia bacterium]